MIFYLIPMFIIAAAALLGGMVIVLMLCWLIYCIRHVKGA